MDELLASFFGTVIAIAAFLPLAKRLGLMDTADGGRKNHEGSIPLIGGLAIFSTIALLSIMFVPPSLEMTYLLIACALLAMTGSIDDRFDLSYHLRLTIQFICASIVVWGCRYKLNELGNILGTGTVSLDFFSAFISIIAIAGMINAYNMIDGIDGLAGGLAMITIASLFYFLNGEITSGTNSILLLMLGSLAAYLLFNLGLLTDRTPKIFMGDSGSMILGFIITIFSIKYSQGEKAAFAPVTALWMVSVPLMDIVATSLRRIRQRKNPFKPDRTHIHHILMRAGLSARGALIVILTFQAASAMIGIALQENAVAEYTSFVLFLIVFGAYSYLLSHAFLITKKVRAMQQGHAKKTNQ